MGTSVSTIALIQLPRAKPHFSTSNSQIYVLINSTCKPVKYYNLLCFNNVRVFDGFVYDNLFDECIEHFSSQLRGVGILLD